MSKKPAKKQHPDASQPLPAQLKAIDRLLDAEDYATAVSKLKSLIRRFPNHGGLRRSLVEALLHAEGSQLACVAAFEWAECRPHSLPAQEALLQYAASLGHLLLADRVARRVRELGGQTSGFPLEPELIESLLTLPDGRRTSAEVLERFDVGKMYMDGLEFAAALRYFEGLDILGAADNRALSLYHLGRIEEAADVFMDNWRSDPENLFALGWLVRLRLYRGDETGALDLCSTLAAATARRGEDALGQLSALLLAQSAQAAWDAFERIRTSAWFAAPLDPAVGAMLHHYGACAASRLGRLDAARALWRQASTTHRDLRLPRENLVIIERNTGVADYPMVFDVPTTLPFEVTRHLQGRSADIFTALAALTAANAYLVKGYLAGDRTTRGLLGLILAYRSGQGDAEAAEAIERFARLPRELLEDHGSLQPTRPNP